jgi:hypothetical protein
MIQAVICYIYKRVLHAALLHKVSKFRGFCLLSSFDRLSTHSLTGNNCRYENCLNAVNFVTCILVVPCLIDDCSSNSPDYTIVGLSLSNKGESETEQKLGTDTSYHILLHSLFIDNPTTGQL